MGYWWESVSDAAGAAGSGAGSGIPPSIIASVCQPTRTTDELLAVRAKAKELRHYDMAAAAQELLTSRERQEQQAAVRALRSAQGRAAARSELTAGEALLTVELLWEEQLGALRREAGRELGDMAQRHSEALDNLRVDQVGQAYETGIRPERRSKELLNLRRSEAVLAANAEFRAAQKVKGRVERLARAEAEEAHVDWLLRSHGEQERVAAEQRREQEALRARLESKLRDAEATRAREMERLERRIRVATEQQRREFVREQRHIASALGGRGWLNTRTTRTGRGVADAFPTLAAAAEAAAAAAASAAAAAVPSGSGLLQPPTLAVPASPSGAAGPGAGAGGGVESPRPKAPAPGQSRPPLVAPGGGGSGAAGASGAGTSSGYLAQLQGGPAAVSTWAQGNPEAAAAAARWSRHDAAEAAAAGPPPPPGMTRPAAPPAPLPPPPPRPPSPPMIQPPPARRAWDFESPRTSGGGASSSTSLSLSLSIPPSPGAGPTARSPPAPRAPPPAPADHPFQLSPAPARSPPAPAPAPAQPRSYAPSPTPAGAAAVPREHPAWRDVAAGAGPWAVPVVSPHGGWAPSSAAAVGSGATGPSGGSSSSALTEAALKAIERASAGPGAGPGGPGLGGMARPGVRFAPPPPQPSSLNSSSFKSNSPYAAGVSARAMGVRA